MTRRRGFKIFEALVRDPSGCVRAAWPNQTFLADKLTRGQRVVLFGRLSPRKWGGGVHLVDPDYEILDEEDDAGEAERLHTGRRLVSFSETCDGVAMEFDNGAKARADVLIGADGIHSTVRRILFGAEAPRFTGVTAYRGLIPAERVAALGVEVTTQVWMGPGSHLVAYFVAGKRLLNFVANVERDEWTGESWSERGNPDDLRAAFARWDPHLRAILDGVDETFIWGIFDRAPLPQWSTGRVTLLGDACHPMQPHMAQGAAQALEDGVALTACLARGNDVGEALARYERLRKPRTAHVQSLATANKTRFHLPDGPEQQARDSAMAAGGTDWSLATIGWLYGYDAAAAMERGDPGLPEGMR